MFAKAGPKNIRHLPSVPGGHLKVSRVLLLASLVATAVLLPSLAQSNAAPNQKLSGHIRYCRISPPQSGVKLLEDIFQRVSSAPQIAMAKGQLKPQSQEVFPLQSEGRLNQGLAIRPKQAGKNALLPSPSLQLIASAPAASPAKPVGQGVVAYRAPEPPASEIWMGSSFQSQSRATPSQSQQSAQSPGIWESAQTGGQQILNGLLAGNGPAAEPESPACDQEVQALKEKRSCLKAQTRNRAPQHVADLASTTGKLFNLSRKLEEAQKIATAPPPPPSETERGKAFEKTAYAKKKASQPAGDAAMPVLTLGGRAGSLNDSLNADEARNSAPPYLSYNRKGVSQFPPSRQDNARVATLAKDAREESDKKPGFWQDRDSFEQNKQDLSDSYARKELKTLGGRDVIALLPPNVVTGIPLVRLGISEAQASSALTDIGSMKQQKVNNWTVWSWQRPQAKNGTSLQLYMRHGLLDAMRIFEPSLIASDFGVSLGDSLATVKEKFGEPAFILSEPTPGAGQNYIYPISQVGFQLARPAPDQSPRVVSVLIFNVK